MKIRIKHRGTEVEIEETNLKEGDYSTMHYGGDVDKITKVITLIVEQIKQIENVGQQH